MSRSDDGRDTYRDFTRAVNMKPGELSMWLDEESKEVGWHMAQRPSGDVRDTRWRWSLMNWGHDPLK
jgi:predicted membrane-bound dolichyl-phosphate-mannose-protein mannosyltransferase